AAEILLLVADDPSGHPRAFADQMKMSVAREIAKAQEKQSCEHLRDPRVAEDFCFVAGQPRNKFFGRRQGSASIGGGRSESRRVSASERQCSMARRRGVFAVSRFVPKSEVQPASS